MTKTEEIKSAVDRAVNWLINSGIQNIDPGKKNIYGSFNAWYEEDTGIYPFVYSEITGYMLTMMCYLWGRDKKQEYLERAKLTGDWLLNVVHESNGGFRCLYPLNPSRFDFKKDQMYAFDNGIILNGLVNLYRVTRQEKYLVAAVTVADWLVYSAQKPSGAFFPIYQLNEERFFEADKEWSMTSGGYHAKIAIGLLNLYDLSRKKKYLESAVKICDFAFSSQNANGRYISYFSRGGTNAHPHCYTAEGLWVAGSFLQREDYLDSSSRAVGWLLDMQSEEGYIPRLFLDDRPVYNERFDALSQAVRLSVIHMSEKRLLPEVKDKIESMLSHILASQARNAGNPKLDGGFYFGKSSAGGKVIPHLNLWVTSFAIQALQAYADYCIGNFNLDPFLIV